MTNVPIPGGVPATDSPASRHRALTRQRFLSAVAVLVLGAVITLLLMLGEPWRLTPDTPASTTRSIVALAVTCLLVLPAFAVFQFERASVGAAWHEPAWRPTAIGLLALAAAVGAALGWHGLRLAFYVARVWTGGP